MIVRFVAAVSLAAWSASACAPDAAPGPDALATWTVDSTPTLTIGLPHNDSADVTFERITGATRRADGQLIVADLGEAPLQLFAKDGTLLRRIARKGSGPGEFEYLAWLWRCGDALFSYDIDGHRVSEFSLDGEYLRGFRFSVPEGQIVPYLSACDARGRFGHIGWASAPRVAGVHRDTVPVWITAAPDAAPMIVDSAPWSERWGQTYQGRIVGSMPLPLGKQPTLAYGPAGFYLSTGDAFEVRVYDSTGTARTPFRLADTAAAVTPADIRDYIEAEIAEAGERARRGIEREHAEITFPERHAAITAMLVDDDGLLWLRPFAPATSTLATWRVLDADGREVARADLPRRLHVFEIGRDYVLGRDIDATEGVPVLRLLRLTRTAVR